MSPAFGYPAKDHALAWRPEMRIWAAIVTGGGLIEHERFVLLRTKPGTQIRPTKGVHAIVN